MSTSEVYPCTMSYFREETLITLVYAVYAYTPVSRTYYIYMQDERQRLPKYLQGRVKSKDTVIGEGLKVLQCKGACSESSLKFMASVHIIGNMQTVIVINF